MSRTSTPAMLALYTVSLCFCALALEFPLDSLSLSASVISFCSSFTLIHSSLLLPRSGLSLCLYHLVQQLHPSVSPISRQLDRPSTLSSPHSLSTFLAPSLPRYNSVTLSPHSAFLSGYSSRPALCVESHLQGLLLFLTGLCRFRSLSS